MAKVKIDKNLHQRAAKVAAELGYSSVDEFVEHLVEQMLSEHEAAQGEDQAAVEERLRGLGYIE